MEYTKLSNGVKIPLIGLGTMGQMGDLATNNVAFALHNGYELIDTANRYGNEVEVGAGLKKSGVKRENYLLETKLGPTLYETDSAIDDTLIRLAVDYIDIMILHHPVNNYLHAYHMLEKAYQAGKLRAIGLSNFPVEKIREVIENCAVKPMLMQVEGNPYYPAESVKPFCDEAEIALQTWFPLGHGSQGMMNDPIFLSLAEKYSKSPVQIILRWHTQMGFCPVPGSSSPSHINDNASIFDFTLAPEDMERIATVNRHTPFYQVTEESLRRLATTKCNFENQN